VVDNDLGLSVSSPPKNFLDSWLEKKARLEEEQKQRQAQGVVESQATRATTERPQVTKVSAGQTPVTGATPIAKPTQEASLAQGVKIEHDRTIRVPKMVAMPAADARGQGSEPGETVIKLR